MMIKKIFILLLASFVISIFFTTCENPFIQDLSKDNNEQTENNNTNGVEITIGEDGYIYINGEKTDFRAYGNPGEQGSFVPVVNIIGVLESTIVGTPFNLAGLILPLNASNQDIIWTVKDAGMTEAVIDGNVFNAVVPGKATITAIITDGIALGTDFIKDFEITVNVVSITNIINVPTAAIANIPLALTGTVTPDNATNTTIIWTVRNARTTGAVIANNTLNTNALGTVTLTATIINGKTLSEAYTQDFDISVESVAVTGIINLPQTATTTVPLTLMGTVMPANATNNTITWSVKDAGTTGAEVDDDILITTNTGAVTLTATVINGIAQGAPFVQDFDLFVDVVEVTGIIDVPTTAIGNVPLTLSGTVIPGNANNAITWSVKNAGTTGAEIDGSTLNTTALGTVTVTATIEHGVALGTAYIKDFDIQVTLVAVTGITDVTASVYAGTPSAINATVLPANASYNTITWTVKNAGGTGASISGNTLTTITHGTVVLTATITDGVSSGVDYIQDFIVSANILTVINISNVPLTATVNVPLILTGTVTPDEATYKTITWSVKNAGGTGANIAGNTLTATTAGTVVVTATITNGTSSGVTYTQDFNIFVDVVAVTGISNVPTISIANVPLNLTGIVTPENASYREIIWSVKNGGGTGAEITGNTLTATAAGSIIVTATIENGSALGVTFVRDFEITVNDGGGTITLSLDGFTPTDTGAGYFDFQPITLSKSGTSTRAVDTSGLDVIAWHVGIINIGYGSSITLNAASFNTGNYTLYCTFMMDDRPWMGSISFTVTE